VRRRPFWPWALALILLAATGFAGYYVYTKVQDQLAGSKTIAVQDYRGILESLARKKILAAHLQPKIKREPNESQAAGLVFAQNPDPGTHVSKNTVVTILVSTGKPKVTVPDVRGRSVDDAVSALVSAGLRVNRVYIHSDKPQGTVTAQDPGPSARVVKGTPVRINVSEGPAPVTVPSVIGEQLSQAISELQGAGFKVGAPRYQDSDQPKDQVLGQDPGGNTQAPAGTTVTLLVSSGPKSVTVPDVTKLDVQSATLQLRSAGFKVAVQTVTTTDPNLDGQVIAQTPQGGTQAPAKSTVTLTVGKYVAPPPTTPTDTTATTP
jgi:serine/threonine-protein kinase